MRAVLPHHPPRLHAIAYMVAAVFMFAIMDALIKAMSARYGALQVSCLRCLSSLACMVPLLVTRGRWRSLRTPDIGRYLLRGMLGITMLATFISGVRQLTLTQAYSLFLTAPLMMTALSVPLFHERIPLRRWLAILIGFGGILVILKPWQRGAYPVLPAAAVALATLCYALSALMVPSLSRTNSRLSLVFWYLLLVAIGSGALSVHDWRPLQPHDFYRLGAMGISGTLGQLWLTEAFSRAPPSVVGPFEYSALLWALVIDQVIWSASPSPSLLLGALLIIGSGVFIIEDERRLAVDTPP